MTYFAESRQSLGLFFIEFKFCESDIYSLNGSKICMVATYNFASVYMYTYLFYFKVLWLAPVRDAWNNLQV